MNRQCSGTMLGPGGQLRRSCTPGRFRRYPARGRGSSASSIETPSGGSSSPRGPTSQSGVPSSLAHAIGAGLVDECHLFLCPIVVGGGKRALPDNVRAQLELLDERPFRNGVVYLHYRVSFCPSRRRDTRQRPALAIARASGWLAAATRSARKGATLGRTRRAH